METANLRFLSQEFLHMFSNYQINYEKKKRPKLEIVRNDDFDKFILNAPKCFVDCVLKKIHQTM